MKVINSKLAAIGLAAFVFASCSDSTDTPNSGNGNSVVDITTIGLTQSDAAQLASSVSNYKKSATAKARQLSRAIDADLFAGLTSMKEIPSDADANRLNSATDLTGGEWKTQGEGKTFDFTGKNIQNTKIFVEGGTTLIYDKTGDNNHFYVKKGGKLIFKGTGSAIAANDEVIVVESGSFSSENDITIDGTLYSTTSLGKVTGPANNKTPLQNITINGKVYLSGYTHEVKDETSSNYGKTLTEFASLRAKDLKISAGAKVNTEDKIVFTNNLTLAGALHVAKSVEVDNMTINDGGDFSSDASVKVKNALTMNAGSKMTVDYLNVTDNEYDDEGKEKQKVADGDATLTLNGNCQIVIGDHGVINVNNLKTDNSADQIVLGGGADNVAVIKADKFIYGGSGEVNCISTPNTNNQVFLLQFGKECYKNGEATDANKVLFDDLAFSASYLDYDKATGGEALVAQPNHTWKLSNEATIAAQPKLDLISDINSPADNQSATSIQPANGKLYVSYHTRNTSFGGNIEVAQFANNKIEVLQNVQQQSAAYDFNHLNIINNRVYLAGSDHAGAIISYVPLTGDGLLNTEAGMKAASIDNKTKGDANCIAAYNGKVVVANTKGYDILDNELATDQNVATPGKAKFMAVSGSNLIGLNYANAVAAGNTAVNGTVQVFNSADLSSTSRTIEVGEIAPNNGKNMVAVDNNGRIYVCKSAKGLAVYNADGSKAWEKDWVTPVSSSDNNNQVDKRQGYINGVAVDNNYVYVAAGSYGLVVLDKDGKEIAHRNIGQNSANYVAVENGNIYVAYGEGRIQIFKLTSTTK